MFLPARKACAFYGICIRTLHRWRDSGKINIVTSPSGRALYECVILDDNARKDYCYCCVKEDSDKANLLKQEEVLSELYPKCTILKDIGVGYDREKFTFLVDEVIKRHVSKIIVISKDILFDKESDFDFFQFILSRCQTDIIIPQTKLGTEMENKKKILSILSKLGK